MWNWSQQPDFHHCWAKNCMGIPLGIPETQWFCLKPLKAVNFKHFEHFPSIEKFKKTNFAANHCEYVWEWSQQPDFYHCWAKNCMGKPWGIPEIQWFCLEQLKTVFKHFERFSAIKKFKKTNFAATHCEYVCDWSQQPDFHHCWAKNCMGIPNGLPEIQLFCLKQLKIAYFKHFEHFPAIRKFKKQILPQITLNMCETGHNKLTFTFVEQKIAWEYLEAYLRYSDFA